MTSMHALILHVQTRFLQEEVISLFLNELPQTINMLSLSQCGSNCTAYDISWFKVAVSVTDSDGPETYRSRCIGRVSADTQNKMIKIFKNY